MYELVTGKLPFYSKDALELTRMHKEVTPTSSRNINPEIPSELDQIILKVLSKEQTNRYRTADQFGRVLENLKDTIKNKTQSGNTHSVKMHDSIQDMQSGTNLQETPSAELETSFDWKTAVLALFAFLLAGGLIPFWLYIWFSLNSGR